MRSVSTRFRGELPIIGEETRWLETRAPYLEGDAYYWSSQNPYTNPHSFDQLAALARSVRSSLRNDDGSARLWVAPFTPGFDKQLAGGASCVPRKGNATLGKLFAGNGKTQPDAFGLTSWNEITEGTYIDPMTRYGTSGLAALSALIRLAG